MDRRSELVERRVRLAHPDEVDPAWNPRHPELAYAADAVSLLMPYGEPYFVRTIRKAIPQLEAAGEVALAEEARTFAAQEARHHAEHRRFNDRLVAAQPGLARIERWMGRTYSWLERTRTQRFSLAFAAGSETIAFSIARWADAHDDDLFDGVAPPTAALFRWHLAEEVEHKAVAHDVWRAAAGGRGRYVVASLLTFVLLAWFTVLATFTLLLGSRYRWRPGCWLRLVVWAFGIAFTTLPNMVVSMLPGHHPSQLVDPPGLVTWLRYFDPATGTVPLLDVGGPTSALDRLFSTAPPTTVPPSTVPESAVLPTPLDRRPGRCPPDRARQPPPTVPAPSHPPSEPLDTSPATRLARHRARR